MKGRRAHLRVSFIPGFMRTTSALQCKEDICDFILNVVMPMLKNKENQ